MCSVCQWTVNTVGRVDVDDLYGSLSPRCTATSPARATHRPAVGRVLTVSRPNCTPVCQPARPVHALNPTPATSTDELLYGHFVA